MLNTTQPLPPAATQLLHTLAKLGFPLSPVIVPGAHLRVVTGEDVGTLLAAGRRPVTIDVQVPGMTAAERARVARRIEALSRDCGCRSGRIAVAVATGAVLLAMSIHLAVSGSAWPSLTHLAVGVGAVAASALAGKIFGLVTAARHWRTQLELLIEATTTT